MPWADDCGPGRALAFRGGRLARDAVGPNLAPPGEISDYRYAHPRFSHELRSDLGFGACAGRAPTRSAVESYFYQDPGRTGRIALRLVKDAGSVVHRYSASWEHVPGVIPGAIAGVRLAPAFSRSGARTSTAASPARAQRRRLVYDDAYGLRLRRADRSERASSATTRVLLPQPADTARWIVGLVRERRDEDERSSWASRSEFTTPRRDASRARTDTAIAATAARRRGRDALSVRPVRQPDPAHRRQRPRDPFGYDASGSVVTSRTDPPLQGGEPGQVTRWTPHPVLARADRGRARLSRRAAQRGRARRVRPRGRDLAGAARALGRRRARARVRGELRRPRGAAVRRAIPVRRRGARRDPHGGGRRRLRRRVEDDPRRGARERYAAVRGIGDLSRPGRSGARARPGISRARKTTCVAA